ncbi:MAG: glucosaminidase domain-containing protein [Ketobacteraceae bacterium]|nr:glucosaminidase domain-containing protein [Ketobacteraceae bacterium]
MQHSTRSLLIALAIIVGFLIIHHYIVGQLTSSSGTSSFTRTQLPDFAAYDNVKEKKQAFFEYLRPLAEEENQRLAQLRASLDTLSESKLKKLADDYGLPEDSDNLAEKLKKRIDEIPVSLVLAQAAIESAWGTSRFARKGNNLFGQWCFTEGCGMVPQARAADASHEVRTFKTARNAIRSYMHNLNSHRAYSKVRQLRTRQRASNESLSGCYLAEGLESYSEKGARYVDMVKSMIRINKLESNKQYCAPRVIAKPETKTEAKQTPPASKATDETGQDDSA